MISRIIILYLFTIVSCAAGSGEQQQNKIRYNFPQQSVVSKMPEACNAISNPMNTLGGLFNDFITGDVTFTAAEEKDFGKRMKGVMDKEFRYVAKEAVDVQKVNGILQKIKPHIVRKEVNYSIVVVNDEKTVNAWTHSGGYIYITKALLNQVASEDELAFVIAHEVAHNENRHCDLALKRVKAATQLTGDQDLGHIVVAVLQSIFAGFDQMQEVEADLGAVYLAYKAGYDPSLGLQFFERLAKEEEKTELGKLLNSHPYSADRKNCLETYLKEARVQ